jgi:hypothetical protein
MKIKNIIIFTHILFGITTSVLLIRAIFFGTCWIWTLLNLMIYVNTWASLERTKERKEMESLRSKYEKDKSSNK